MADLRERTRAFGFRLGVVAVVAALVRLAYDLIALRRLHLGLDSTWYFLQGGVIRHERAFADVAVFATDRAPTAAWPPLYPALLAAVRVVAGDSIRAAQLVGVATGCATVVLTGLIGRIVAGRTIGLLAAALVAVNPLLIAADGSLMSETLFVPLALGALLVALVAARTRSWWYWTATGVIVGSAALTRAEGLLLIPFVVLPIAWNAYRGSAVRAVVAVSVATSVCAVVVAPWVLRNEVRVDAPTVATVSSATAIAGANCAQVYRGDAIGSWAFACIHDELRAGRTEAEWTADIRDAGIRYARDHTGRLPVVGAARIARLVGLWDPADQVDREALETRHRGWQYVVAGTAAVTFVAGSVGIVMLGRRRRPIGGIAGLVVMSVAVALSTYGNTRFRSSCGARADDRPRRASRPATRTESDRGPAAVDAEDLAGHEAARVAREEEQRAVELVLVAAAAHRRALAHPAFARSRRRTSGRRSSRCGTSPARGS